MKSFLKICFTAAICMSIYSCNKEDSQPAIPNNSTAEVDNSQRTIASLLTNFFKPKTGAVKGIVILGSGNSPQDPTPGDINEAYLVALSKSLAAKGFACAIVQYRDQPNVGVNFVNFNSNRDMLISDFNAVANALRTEFSIDRNKVIFGGSSYSANCLLSHNAWGNAMTDIKGIVAVMGSSDLSAAKNQKSPILAFACNGEPFGTNYGNSIVQNITNATVKAKSFGLTDNSCNGHSTSNNWIPTITDKILVWIP